MSDPVLRSAINPVGVPLDASARMGAQARAVRKVLVRLVPLAIILYMFNYLDRVNVSVAKLDMDHALNFSDAIYGFGVSIYFIGYFIFEVPSNLILHRIGARRWIARIMISWGVIAAAMMFIRGQYSFYILRLLLGTAEAGFFPGIMLYLTYWVPAPQRSGVGSVFFTSTAIASIFGYPISAALMQIHAFGLAGWQWLFLLEGIPTILIGIVVFMILPDRPREAAWLDEDERDALTAALGAEEAAQHPDSHRLLYAIKSPMLWVLTLQYGLILFAFYGLVFWIPSIIKASCHESTAVVGFLCAIPFCAAIVGMVLIGYITDFLRAPNFAIIFGALLGAAGMAGCALASSTGWIIVWLSLAAIGIYGTLAPFWSLPPTILRGAAAAAGIAIINSFGNLSGGFIEPNVAGYFVTIYHTYEAALFCNAAVLVIAAGVAIAVAMEARSKATGAAIAGGRGG